MRRVCAGQSVGQVSRHLKHSKREDLINQKASSVKDRFVLDTAKLGTGDLQFTIHLKLVMSVQEK